MEKSISLKLTVSSEPDWIRVRLASQIEKCISPVACALGKSQNW